MVTLKVAEICYVVFQFNLVCLKSQILDVRIIERDVAKLANVFKGVCIIEVTVVDVFNLLVPLAFQGVSLLDNDLK